MIFGIFALNTVTGCGTSDHPSGLTITETADYSTETSGYSTETSGYSFVAYEGQSIKGEAFLVCGTNGRLDRIFSDNSVETIPLDTDKDLTQALISSDITIISGRSGAMLYSRDGQSFSHCDKFTNSDILGLTHFRDKYYSCAMDGTIFASDEGISWKLCDKLINKPIIAISSTDAYCMAITADTDIFITEDGIIWHQQNFNNVYDGFYEKHVFTNLIGQGMTFFILGYPKDDPDRPMTMFSDSGGEVWMFKTLDEINSEEPETYFPMRINSVCLVAEDILGACNGGRVVTITACSSCNLVSEVTNVDLRCIAIGEEEVLVVGDDFQFSFKGSLD